MKTNNINISQAAIAKWIGISPTRLCRILNGSQPISYKMAYEWSLKFGRSMDFWLYESGEKIFQQLKDSYESGENTNGK